MVFVLNRPPIMISLRKSKSFPKSLIPKNDGARLRTLHLYQIVNTTPEKVFDNYVAWAAQLFNVPISLISLVDEKRTWHKALVGAGEVPSLPREQSMCSAAILQDDAIVISDFAPDSCALISPYVAQEMGLHFYAGSALKMPDEARVGMLVIIDRQSRSFSPTEGTVLSQLAGLVSQTIGLRVRYLLAKQEENWEGVQQELIDALDESSALARYLTTRNKHIDLDDQATMQAIQHQLKSVAAVLSRRLAETAAYDPLPASAALG